MGEEIRAATKPHVNSDDWYIDHGKTTLTAAITKVLSSTTRKWRSGVDTIDNAPEERERGSPIAVVARGYETANRHYAHMDCGACGLHQEMITGAGRWTADSVSATDGQCADAGAHSGAQVVPAIVVF